MSKQSGYRVTLTSGSIPNRLSNRTLKIPAPTTRREAPWKLPAARPPKERRAGVSARLAAEFSLDQTAKCLNCDTLQVLGKPA